MKITDISEIRQAKDGWVLTIFMNTIHNDYPPELIRIEFIHHVNSSTGDTVHYHRYSYLSDAYRAGIGLGLCEKDIVGDAMSTDHLVPYGFLCESVSDLIEELPLHLVYRNAPTIRRAQRIWDERVVHLVGKVQDI